MEPIEPSHRGAALAAMLHQALDTCSQPVALIDSQRCIILCNSAFLTQFDRPATDIAGRPLTDAFPQFRQSQLEEGLSLLSDTNPALRVPGVLASGFLACAIELHDWGYVLAFEDPLLKSRAEKNQWELLDGIAHALQTPLTSTSGYAETLLKTGLADTETSLGFIERILAQSRQVTEIVNQLLFMSRLQGSPDSMSRELLDLRRPVAEAVQAAMAVAEQRGQGIDVAMPQSPVIVRGSHQALNMLVANLLDNALKYAGYGGQIDVEITVGNERARAVIADDGPGIPPETQARIFDRFYRSDDARRGEYGGAGLGLTLVRHVAEAHSGSVTVESQPASGTRFSVELPLAE